MGERDRKLELIDRSCNVNMAWLVPCFSFVICVFGRFNYMHAENVVHFVVILLASMFSGS